MDALVRSRRLLLIAAAIAVGCASAHRSDPVGVSHAPHGNAGDAKAVDAGAGPRKTAAAAGVPPDYRTSLVKVNRARFVTNGHAAGRWDADVYATQPAKDAALSGAAGGDLPAGTRLVMEHAERAPEPKPGPLMMMEKMEHGFDPDHGDWRYVVINANGEVVQEGRIESCAGCHDDAPRDHVFRITE